MRASALRLLHLVGLPQLLRRYRKLVGLGELVWIWTWVCEDCPGVYVFLVGVGEAWMVWMVLCQRAVVGRMCRLRVLGRLLDHPHSPGTYDIEVDAA